jgi:hypothetical protein
MSHPNNKQCNTAPFFGSLEFAEEYLSSPDPEEATVFYLKQDYTKEMEENGLSKTKLALLAENVRVAVLNALANGTDPNSDPIVRKRFGPNFKFTRFGVRTMSKKTKTEAAGSSLELALYSSTSESYVIVSSPATIFFAVETFFSDLYDKEGVRFVVGVDTIISYLSNNNNFGDVFKKQLAYLFGKVTADEVAQKKEALDRMPSRPSIAKTPSLKGRVNKHKKDRRSALRKETSADIEDILTKVNQNTEELGKKNSC